MHELRTISGERGQNNGNKGPAQRLAAKQARLLKQLMTANSRLQRRIHDVLDPQQRKKLDSFRPTTEVRAEKGKGGGKRRGTEGQLFPPPTFFYPYSQTTPPTPFWC